MASQSEYDPVEFERLVNERVRQRLAAIGAEEDRWWMWKTIGYASVLATICLALGLGLNVIAKWL